MRRLMSWVKEKYELAYLIFYAYHSKQPGIPFHISLIFLSFFITFSFLLIIDIFHLIYPGDYFFNTISFLILVVTSIFIFSWKHFKNNEFVLFLNQKYLVDKWYKNKHIWILSLIFILVILVRAAMAVVYHELYGGG